MALGLTDRDLERIHEMSLMDINMGLHKGLFDRGVWCYLKLDRCINASHGLLRAPYINLWDISMTT